MALGKLARRRTQFGIRRSERTATRAEIALAADSSTSGTRGLLLAATATTSSSTDRSRLEGRRGGRCGRHATRPAARCPRGPTWVMLARICAARGRRQEDAEIFLGQPQRAGPAVHGVEADHDPDHLEDLPVAEVLAHRADIAVGDRLGCHRQLPGCLQRARSARVNWGPILVHSRGDPVLGHAGTLSVASHCGPCNTRSCCSATPPRRAWS